MVVIPRVLYILNKKGCGGMKDCISRSKIKLKEYQIKVVNFINDDDNDSLLVVHGTGLGKSLSALTASQCYLDRNPYSRVVVISPASLIGNFEKEMKKYGSKLSESYKFYSFDKFSRMSNYNCGNSMIIIDEAHNLRAAKVRFEAAFKCIKKCDKLLLLTATPFVNSLLDFNPLINLLDRGNIRTNMIQDVKPEHSYDYSFFGLPSSLSNYEKMLMHLGKVLEGRVSFISEKDTLYFPKVFIKKVELTMSRNFYEKYERALKIDKEFGKNPEKFFSGYRQAVNSVGSLEYLNHKLENIEEILVNKKQTLIFTNWLENGIGILIKYLSELGVSCDVISGNVDPKIRLNIVNNYNLSKFQVLLITKAGSEGLDLKNTGNIIILDPVWNMATLDQIIGRGVRYKSHINLPKSRRIVDVFLIILKTPKYAKLPSGDQLLYDILERKEMIRNDVENILKNVSI
jgi:superfamily II DNA or RNA helicase